MKKPILILGVLLGTAFQVHADEMASSKQMKAFECKGVYEIQSLQVNAPSAEIAVGLYQIATVLPDKKRGSTFSGASYNLTDKEVSCSEVIAR